MMHHGVTIVTIIMGIAMMAACSPESFDGANQNGIPVAADYNFTVSVNQESNTATFQFTETAGVYPIWIIDGAYYSTLNEVSYANTEAGTHTVELKIGNRNGFSQGSVAQTFTFNETKIDYTSEFKKITGKEWRIDNKEAAHLACGPVGTDGAGWWAASADEKSGTGLYDDRITFTADNQNGGTYSYSPGEDGLTYVNTATTLWGASDADWDATIGAQTSTWQFVVDDWTDSEGNVSKVTYIQLGANTAFPYISSDEQYQNPKFRVESLSAKKLVLVYDKPDGSIAWRFIFTSEAEEKAFEGFDPNSDCNLFKSCNYDISFWYADENWSQLADPELTTGTNTWSIYLPTANTQQWQTQMAFKTDMTTNAVTNYDFSVLITSDKDINGATVKLTQTDNDDIYFFTDQIDLKANEEYVFYKSNMTGIDITNVKLVLDFGGCQEGTTIDISNIVLKENSCDDGTVLPSEEEKTVETMDWDYTASDNLWLPIYESQLAPAFWYAPGWSQIADPTYSQSGDVYTVTLHEATTDQWMAQMHYDTNLSAKQSDKYNFYCVLESDADHPGVTVKLTDAASDDNFFFADRVPLTAGEEYVYKKEGVSLPNGDAEALNLFFDFGGNAAGTTIKISKIYLVKQQDMSYDSESNLWKAIDESNPTPAFWYAPGWSQIADPTWTQDGNEWTVVLPEATTDQWMAQMHIDTQLSAKQSDTYNFRCVLVADADQPGVTVKLTDAASDDNYFFAERVPLTADEEYVFERTGVTLGTGDAEALNLFFDFGGNPANSKISIKEIYFGKAQ